MQQTGFGFDTDPGFDFGGQGGFSFHSNPEGDWEWAKAEAKRQREARERREQQERQRREEHEREQHHRQRTHTGSTYQDPYDVLGIPRTASSKDIRAAWAKLCRQHHPDVGGDVEMLKRINAAYERLKGGKR